jgi:hypothetical protein
MPVRFGIAVITAVVFTACAEESPAPGAATPVVPRSRCANVVWSADHETGDLSQWHVGDGGGEFNSGEATSSASLDVAHTGRYSAKATITTPHMPNASGVSLFRLNESRTHPEACYSVWYYFPQRYVVPVWWNIFSFRSRNGTAANDGFWELQIGNRPGGAMHLYLTWWGPPLEGPRPGETGLRHFSQSLKDVPVGRWMHVEVDLRQSSGFDGQIIVRQDDVELFNMNNVRTRYPAPNGANEWSVNNYSDIITPTPTTVYIDDAVISTPEI